MRDGESLSILWGQFDFTTAFVVFFVYCLVDGMYAYYTIAVTKRDPVASATVGALMHFLIAFGVLSYVENYLYVIPLACGSWVGTYGIVRYDLHKTRQSPSSSTKISN